MKNMLKILVVLVIVGLTIFFIKWNSDINKNNRYLTDKLLNSETGTSGTGRELFDLDYDKVYVFEPYQSKKDMEEQIGFESSVLIETVSEGMMNVLFAKDDSPVAYLYGYDSNNRYYVDLPTGNHTKSEIDSMRYNVKISGLGNTSEDEGTYRNYIFEK